MNFPSLVPSSRSYTPGQLPIRAYRTLSGAIWKRAFTNTRLGQTIKLQYENIPDTQAELIFAHFESVGGLFNRFALPVEVFQGIGGGITTRLRAPVNIQWAYAQEPTITSVFPGISSVTVDLIGEVVYP